MKDVDNLRRGLAVGAVAVAGLSFVAVSVCGIAAHADLAAQRDIALVSAADNADQVVFDTHVGGDSALAFNDAVVQQDIYSWALDPISTGDLGLSDDSLLFAGSADDSQDYFFTGLLPQLSVADVVDQGPVWTELDFSADVPLVAPQFIDDIIGAGIASDSLFDAGVTQLIDTGALADADGIQGAMLELLQDEVIQTVWGDFFGVFSVADITP